MKEITVYAFHTRTKDFRVVYEFVESAEDAMLLSQLAMLQKQSEEIILIAPGSNKGIDKNPELYSKALRLAQRVLDYMEDDEDDV